MDLGSRCMDGIVGAEVSENLNIRHLARWLSLIFFFSCFSPYTHYNWEPKISAPKSFVEDLRFLFSIELRLLVCAISRPGIVCQRRPLGVSVP